MNRIMVIATTMAWVLTSAISAEADSRSAEEGAIRKAIESYVAAFNEADPKALAAHWSPEAVYTNPFSGVEVTGREAIEEQFAQIFSESPGIKLDATTDSIQFVSPNVAIEHGVATVSRPEHSEGVSQYTAVYVKREGHWLLDRVTEEGLLVPLSHYDQLKELEWLVGRWVDQDDVATVVVECNWTKNQNFLVRSFKVHVEDRIDMAGIQMIGWDPATKQIRSWVFDSDGGFGHGTWTRKENRWYVRKSGVLPDGRKSSEVNIITYLDDNTCTLQSVNRTVDGTLSPNIDEVTVTKG